MRAVAVLTLSLLWAGAAGAQPPAGEPGGLGVSEVELLGTPDGAPLSGAELDERTEALASLMRCPVCQGLSVADSPTPSAIAMKEEVRSLLARGYTDDQVLQYFERSYGEFIRLEPRARGFNLAVWIAPVAGLLLGLGLIVTRLRRKSEPEDAEEAPSVDRELEPYLERVRGEVAG